MKVNIDNKTINVPNAEITRLMTILNLTEDEAIKTWLFDNDYIDNPDVDNLTKLAKENKTDKLVVTDKTTRKKVDRKPKENINKEMIQDVLYYAIQEKLSVENLKVTKKAKLLEFTYLGKEYKVDIIEKREPKEK